MTFPASARTFITAIDEREFTLGAARGAFQAHHVLTALSIRLFSILEQDYCYA
jgi:hypothetical protein